jgi:hypothetical protein
MRDMYKFSQIYLPTFGQLVPSLHLIAGEYVVVIAVLGPFIIVALVARTSAHANVLLVPSFPPGKVPHLNNEHERL